MKILFIQHLGDIDTHRDKSLSSEWDLIIIHEKFNLTPELEEYLQTRLIRANPNSRIIRPSRIEII